MVYKNRRYKDLSGKRFGLLIVKENEYKILDGKHGQWKCKCDCGNEIWAYVAGLTSGKTVSCGCESSNRINLIGNKYGFLTVLSQYGVNNSGVKIWECKCICGAIVYRTRNHLKDSSSCGCLRDLHRIESLKGMEFGRLTVTNNAQEEYIKRGGKECDMKLHLCECNCGNKIWVRTSYLKNGNTKSCGCISHEILLKRNIYLRGENHPHWVGGSKTKKYCYKFSRRSTRERVRLFWGNKCVICGKTEDENKSKLSVHHVLENKSALCDTTPKLFVTLCKSCHSKFHHKYASCETKQYMTNFFLQIIKDRGGKCMYTDEEYFKVYKKIDISDIVKD